MDALEIHQWRVEWSTWVDCVSDKTLGMSRFGVHSVCVRSFSNSSVGRESACNERDAGDVGLIPVRGRSLGEGNGNPLQYSCLENLMDGGMWWIGRAHV